MKENDIQGREGLSQRNYGDADELYRQLFFATDSFSPLPPPPSPWLYAEEKATRVGPALENIRTEALSRAAFMQRDANDSRLDISASIFHNRNKQRRLTAVEGK